MIPCAQAGIDSIGVSKPLINTKIMIKKNITNMVCCIVEERLAMVMPSPDMVRIKRRAAKKIEPIEPAGVSP